LLGKRKISKKPGGVSLLVNTPFTKKEMSMLNTEKFGRRLADLRRKTGKKQHEVAYDLGLTPQAVSKWERGLSCPDILMLDELSASLGVSIADLFENVETR
jgi:DNA-binding XRE family transcriptional regulator